MKREDIEKAAKDYSIGKTYFRRNVLKEVDADNYVLRKGNCSEDFIAGAEWQAKQSPCNHEHCRRYYRRLVLPTLWCVL